MSLLKNVLPLLAAGVFSAASAQATQPSPWSLELSAVAVQFNVQTKAQAGGVTIPGADVTVKDNTTVGMVIGYDLAPRWTAKLAIGLPPTTHMTGTGSLAGTGTLAHIKYGPGVLSATYDLDPIGPVRPFVGGGVSYTKVFSTRDGFLSNTKAKDAWGTVLHAGFALPLQDNWELSFDARKVFVKTKATGLMPGNIPAQADITLDPLLTSIGIRKHF